MTQVAWSPLWSPLHHHLLTPLPNLPCFQVFPSLLPTWYTPIPTSCLPGSRTPTANTKHGIWHLFVGGLFFLVFGFGFCSFLENNFKMLHGKWIDTCPPSAGPADAPVPPHPSSLLWPVPAHAAAQGCSRPSPSWDYCCNPQGCCSHSSPPFILIT